MSEDYLKVPQTSDQVCCMLSVSYAPDEKQTKQHQKSKWIFYYEYHLIKQYISLQKNRKDMKKNRSFGDKERSNFTMIHTHPKTLQRYTHTKFLLRS